MVKKIGILMRLKEQNPEKFLSLQEQALEVAKVDDPQTVLYIMADLLEKQNISNGLQNEKQHHQQNVKNDNLIEENNDKSSVMFTGRNGLIFTDADGIIYRAHTEKLISKEYDMAIYSKEIEPIENKREMNDKEREMIISKIISSTKGVDWLIK